MRKKVIITTEGKYFLSVEEVIEKYNDMVHKFSVDCTMKLSDFQDNYLTEKDYYQDGIMELMRAYRNYDPFLGVCFSTYLQKALNRLIAAYGRRFSAASRCAKQKHLYLNKNVVENADLNTIVTVDKPEIEEDNGLLEYLNENLSKEDRLLLTIQFKKGIYKESGKQKDSLEFALDFFSKGFKEEIFFLTKNELAEKMCISRPTLNKRINETLEKLKRLTKFYIKNIAS